MNDPEVWRNHAPGDLSVELPEVRRDAVSPAVERSSRAYREWRNLTLDERKQALRQCQDNLREKQEEIAALIALEVGKRRREALLEMGGVVAKFDLTFEDADEYGADRFVEGGAHPGLVRRRPRGPAAVIAPFNFPIFLGHGATVAYLLAGNTVLYKPSPMAGLVGAAYAAAMQAALPRGVFEIVQGWADTGRELCLHPEVRSVCFTGSAAAGARLATELAADFSKSLALELGGKNASIICEDADLDSAAEAVADAMCLTTGQRCNSTSRVIVHHKVRQDFLARLAPRLESYKPGDPRSDDCLLGPLVNRQSVERFQSALGETSGEWVVRGEVCEEVDGLRGHYVRPGLLYAEEAVALKTTEIFGPLATVETFTEDGDAVLRHNGVEFGLTASVFTASEERFQRLGGQLEAGNLYWNLPTTFSPSTLPFGGVKNSGNGKPGGRGFIRWAADDQAVQWKVGS